MVIVCGIKSVRDDRSSAAAVLAMVSDDFVPASLELYKTFFIAIQLVQIHLLECLSTIFVECSRYRAKVQLKKQVPENLFIREMFVLLHSF